MAQENPSPALPAIDWSRIELPSDRISLKQVREDADLLGKLSGGISLALTDFPVLHVLRDEHDIAKRAFAKALGRRDPDLFVHPRSEYLNGLNHAYVHYGLSTGMNVTKQMVKKIEDQAAVLARELSGRQP